MQRISITNPQNIIDGTAKKYYFKLRNTGGPKGDKGDKGDTGQTGPQGPKGDAATVAVGSTTTLAVGQDATVENVGSIYNAVLNFGIPQGPQGPQGERGTNATVYVGTTSTLAPGSQATVYNSGTDSNAVLNFGIPKGEKGDTGPMPTIAQSTGQATDQVMSQKATTDALNTKQATITSSNKLSADLVEDTSTTNKFVTASDITNWNAKQDALTAGTGIDITGGVISTPAIVPEVVAELPTTGTEGKLYLTPKAHTTSTATGNPIEATVTEQAGQLESFQLDGDTFQQTYTGKNLFNKNNPNMFVGYVGWNGAINSTNADRMIYIPCEPSTTYSIQKPIPSTNPKFRVAVSTDVPASGGTATVLTDDSYMTLGEATVTTREDSAYLMIYIWVNSSDMTLDEVLSGIQIEVGSSVTSFEPFVGGQPSPNPSYPQPIQTVTGEQTVTVVGKNLFDKSSAERDKILLPDGTVGGYDILYATSDFIPVSPEQTYYKTQSLSVRFKYYNANKEPLNTTTYQDIPNANNAQSFVVPSNAYYIRLTVGVSYLDSLQIELGSTATAYAPYSKQTLPISLGSLELCKLGTYQDYIYKDGDDWKVHKDVGVVVYDGSDDENWSKDTSGTYTRMSIFESLSYDVGAMRVADSLCDHFRADTANAYGIFFRNNRNIYFYPQDSISLISGWKTWLSSNNIIVYYPLKTATDTTITDTTLIAQLEAIRNAQLETGTNTITNNATSPNLAGDMEIGYYGFNPTNRYDKFIWLDLNNNYEQIGGE